MSSAHAAVSEIKSGNAARAVAKEPGSKKVRFAARKTWETCVRVFFQKKEL
jgi:hypothetical protein